MKKLRFTLNLDNFMENIKIVFNPAKRIVLDKTKY
jgi:hypothetical protein